MKNPKSPHSFLLSLFAFFAVVRGYNIALLIAPQYLTSAHILAPHRPLLSVVFDSRLFGTGFGYRLFYRSRIYHQQFL
jgi:hypothetical protein